MRVFEGVFDAYATAISIEMSKKAEKAADEGLSIRKQQNERNYIEETSIIPPSHTITGALGRRLSGIRASSYQIRL